jgi:DNA-binding transcriptional LysR family regulator
MDTLQQMRVFVRITEAGTFTAAAATLDTTTGAVSRIMAELESRLRTRLLNRTTRQIALTSAGEQYLERCKQILADVSIAEEEASRASERPFGRLRVHSFTSVGQRYVIPAIAHYRNLHPDVSVELSLSQGVADLFEGGTDVAVTATSTYLPDSELVSIFLGESYSILCASPEYQSKHSMPQTPHDLNDHECLILKNRAFPAHEWLLESAEGDESMAVSGAVEINVADAIGIAIRQGMGIGVLPVYAALEGLADGSLIRVLPEHTLQRIKIYAVHPSRRFTDAKIRTWIEALKECVPSMLANDTASLREVSKVLSQDREKTSGPVSD